MLKMKAIFGRKVADINELKELTREAVSRGQIGQSYCVKREVLLDDNEFNAFADDFFNDQPWIQKGDGGVNEMGEVRCIRVINKDTGERVLSNPEGYSYCRYVALEND